MIVDNFLLAIRRSTEILIKENGERKRERKENKRDRKKGENGGNGDFCFHTHITYADILKRSITTVSRWISLTTDWRYSNAVGYATDEGGNSGIGIHASWSVHFSSQLNLRIFLTAFTRENTSLRSDGRREKGKEVIQSRETGKNISLCPSAIGYVRIAILRLFHTTMEEGIMQKQFLWKEI